MVEALWSVTTSYNAELNTCLIGHVFISDVKDKEL